MGKRKPRTRQTTQTTQTTLFGGGHNVQGNGPGWYEARPVPEVPAPRHSVAARKGHTKAGRVGGQIVTPGHVGKPGTAEARAASRAGGSPPVASADPALQKCKGCGLSIGSGNYCADCAIAGSPDGEATKDCDNCFYEATSQTKQPCKACISTPDWWDKPRHWQPLRQAKGTPAAALATYKDGRLKPQVGDRVYQEVPGAFGTPAVIEGEIYETRDGKLRVRVTDTKTLGIAGQASAKTYALDSHWTVIDDPEIARREKVREAKKAKQVEQEKADRARAREQHEASKAKALTAQGHLPLTPENTKPGAVIFRHPSPRVPDDTAETMIVTEIDDQGNIYARSINDPPGKGGGFIGNASEYTVPAKNSNKNSSRTVENSKVSSKAIKKKEPWQMSRAAWEQGVRDEEGSLPRATEQFLAGLNFEKGSDAYSGEEFTDIRATAALKRTMGKALKRKIGYRGVGTPELNKHLVGEGHLYHLNISPGPGGDRLWVSRKPLEQVHVESLEMWEEKGHTIPPEVITEARQRLDDSKKPAPVSSVKVTEGAGDRRGKWNNLYYGGARYGFNGERWARGMEPPREVLEEARRQGYGHLFERARSQDAKEAGR